MTKNGIPGVNTSFNHNHSFNLSHNLGSTGGHDKKAKKYASSSNKHVKQGVYSSYTNVTKKKHPRASSNTEASHLHISKDEFSQSPDTVNVRKAYGKDPKKKGTRDNRKASALSKAIPGFGFAGD